MQSDMEFEVHNLERIAYVAVLRVFKSQSHTLTWEKEGLLTDLRKNLGVSNEEHGELLSEVVADDFIRRIQEWRKSGGGRTVTLFAAPHVNNQLPCQTVSASGIKQEALHPHSMGPTTQPLSSGIGGRRPNAGQPGISTAKPMQYQHIDHASGAPTGNLSESIRGPLIGRKVMIRWPAESNFYEAVITDYNPVDGRHSLVYDHNTPNETLEWVNMKEVPPEDIRWVTDNPVTSRLCEPGVPHIGRARTSSMNQFIDETRVSLSGNGVDLGEIEIYHTDTLIKKVEKMLDASHPAELEIDMAKKLIKEHEETLIQVIAKLADACGSGDEDTD